MTKAFAFIQNLFMPFCFVMFVVSCVTLFYSAERVQALRSELKMTERKIEKEQENYRVLTAEWTYLNTPERLVAMAKQHLRLKPKSPRQLVKWDKVPEKMGGVQNASATTDGIEWSNYEASDYMASSKKYQKNIGVEEEDTKTENQEGVSLKDLWKN